MKTLKTLSLTLILLLGIGLLNADAQRMQNRGNAGQGINADTNTGMIDGNRAGLNAGNRAGMNAGNRSGWAAAGILSPEMTEVLQLTDQQRLQILDLRNTQMTSRQEMRSTFREGDTTPNEMRAKRDAMQEAHQAQLREILTEEQYSKLVTLREERRAVNRSQRPANRGVDGAGTRGNRGPRGQ